jgi:hypothetical protein
VTRAQLVALTAIAAAVVLGALFYGVLRMYAG